MASTTTSHRHKRPFQPQITNYFTRTDREEYGTSNHARPAPLQGPELPHSVQASLLSVGMRIRKSVPEGYKTHKTMLFEDPTPAKTASSSGYGGYSQDSLRSRPVELTPFCGLHKIGGLSVQPVNAQSEIDVFNDDPLFPDSSQESTASTLSTDSMPARPSIWNTNKRRFEDEENEQEGIEGQEYDLEVSPLSMFPVGHTAMPNLSSISKARVLAKPRSRRMGVAMHVETGVHDSDFEDAEFLVPWDEGEVEMGGT